MAANGKAFLKVRPHDIRKSKYYPSGAAWRMVA
jgi:hypothetical protein